MKIPDTITVEKWRDAVETAAVNPTIPSKIALDDVLSTVYNSSYGKEGLHALRIELTKHAVTNRAFLKRMPFITKQLHAFEERMLSQKTTSKSIWERMDPHLNGILGSLIGEKGLLAAYVGMFAAAIQNAMDFYYGAPKNGITGVLEHHGTWIKSQRSILET